MLKIADMNNHHWTFFNVVRFMHARIGLLLAVFLMAFSWVDNVHSAPGAPEINVTRDGVTIPDGSLTLRPETRFPATKVNGGVSTVTFTIENTGSDALVLGANAVSISGGTTPEAFTVTMQPAETVEAGGSTMFTIAFDPISIVMDFLTSNVSITNNDADENPYDFVIGGAGLPDPLFRTGFYPSTVAAGEQTTLSFSIHSPHGSRYNNISFSNTLPAGLEVTGPAFAKGCSLREHPADFSVSGITVFYKQSCYIQIPVVANTAGVYVNTSSSLTATSDEGLEFTVAPVSATLTVTGARRMIVSGNGIEIADGDSTPSIADGSRFEAVEQGSAGPVHIFTIANHGTDDLVLGSNAVTIAGYRRDSFIITKQPAETVGPGKTTTFEVYFRPAGGGEHRANLLVANNDGDGAPYEFALLGDGISASSSIQINLIISGPDRYVHFSSSTPGLWFSLMTQNGRGVHNIYPRYGAGTYVITAEDLAAAGYGLASIDCNDTDSTGDVASRSATINLADGEFVTCTFVAVETRTVTSRMIGDYVGARNTMLMNHQPDIGRRIDRLRDRMGMSDPFFRASALGMSARIPFPVNIGLDQQMLSYSGSLLDIRTFFANRSDQGIAIPDLGAWNIWSEGQFSLFDDKSSQKGRFGIVHLGADYLVSPDFLVGVKGQVDWMDQKFAATSGKVSGVGWMVGPYGTLRLTDNFYLDLGAYWGTSRNRIAPFGTYRDTFKTTRWLVHGAFVGDFTYDQLKIAPRLSLAYVSEQQHAYVDGLNVAIPSQTVSQGQVEFSPRLSTAIGLDGGGLISPWMEVSGRYVFGTSGQFSGNSFSQKMLGLSAGLKAGFSYQLPGGAHLELSGHYDGIGSGTENYGGRFNVSVPLN